MPLIHQPSSDLNQKQVEHNRNNTPSRISIPLHDQNKPRTRSQEDVGLEAEPANALNKPRVANEQTEKQVKALAMKMQVPNTVAFIPTTIDKKILSKREAQSRNEEEHRLGSRSLQEARASAFDDTQSLSFHDTFLQDNDNRTMVFRGSQTQPPQPHPQRNIVGSRSKGHFDDTVDLQSSNFNLSDDFENQIETGRFIQGQENFSRDKMLRITDSKSAKIENQAQLTDEHYHVLIDTPSRAQTVPPPRSAPTTKAVSFDSPGINSRELARADSPELEMPQDVISSKTMFGGRHIGHLRDDNRRTKANRDLENRSNPANTVSSTTSLFAQSGGPASRSSNTNTLAPLRASDCPNSSDEEVLPNLYNSGAPAPAVAVRDDTTSRKRPHIEELDYDVAVLKTMKYDDLVQQDFGEDPQNTDPRLSLNTHGKSTQWTQQLRNLASIAEDEQRNIFRNQTDHDWVQTGSWFIEKFQEDLKRLINVRIERRKISMRFENEIRRRQKDIDWASTGIDEELKDLKKGGGELIRGRDISSKKNTPQKI